jgi:serine/threonine-protein kinase
MLRSSSNMRRARSYLTALPTELARISRAYQREARAMSYRELRARQHAPWASIAYGAAGIAAAFWLSAPGRHAAQNRAQAQRWLVAASRGARAHDALWIPGSAETSVDGSLYYGADGIQFLRLLVAHAAAVAGDRRRGAYDRSLRGFLERCRRRRSGPSELVQGVAGYLTALVLLYETTRDARILGVADELAHDLLERAGGRAGWARSPSLGFAHGRAGISHALLGWSFLPDRELPVEFFRHLDRLARDVSRHGTAGAPGSSTAAGRVLERSWCNGASGHVLHWARAYERTSEATYLRAARDAAHLVSTRTDAAPGDLCCGLGGRAYALLAMDRIEPGRGWFERAIAMGSLAATTMVDHSGPWPNGLYKGYPGLVCLETALRGDRVDRVGFPLVEGPAARAGPPSPTELATPAPGSFAGSRKRIQSPR